ncbi:MAG: T9SS type A sorting domain-containing protein, partial [Bacteroidia bacterium]
TTNRWLRGQSKFRSQAKDSSTLFFAYEVYNKFKDDFCVLIDTFVVEQKPYPVARNYKDTAVCRTDTLLKLDGRFPYLIWNGDNVGTYGNYQAFNPVNADSNFTLTVKYGFHKECESFSSFKVDVVDLPSADAGTDTTFCLNKDIIFYNFKNQNGLWKGKNIFGSSTAKYTPSDTVGIYKYRLVESNSLGCKQIDTMLVFVGRKPKLPFTIDIDSGEAPLEVNFNSNFKNTGFYTWFFGTGDSISNTPNPTYNYYKAGLYSVRVKAKDSLGVCYNENVQNDFIIVTDPSSIADVENRVMVYPNPSKSAFNLKVFDNNSIDQIMLFDVNGKIVHSNSSFITSQSFGSALKPGTYHLNIYWKSGGVSTIKLVKY